MKNMNQMMRQVKKMQDQMMKAQEELADKTVEGTSGGGVVKVTATGQRKVTDIEISPEAVDPERSEEHTSELQSRGHLVCRLLLEKKKDRRGERCMIGST